MRVLFDTNIVLDLLLNRKELIEDSANIVEMVDRKQAKAELNHYALKVHSGCSWTESPNHIIQGSYCLHQHSMDFYDAPNTIEPSHL